VLDCTSLARERGATSPRTLTTFLPQGTELTGSRPTLPIASPVLHVFQLGSGEGAGLLQGHAVSSDACLEALPRFITPVLIRGEASAHMQIRAALTPSGALPGGPEVLGQGPASH
jgi:hypothetical protein